MTESTQITPHFQALPPERLTDRERAELAALEETIDDGGRIFVKVGLALHRINDGRLFRETHGSFVEYARDRFQYEKTQAYDTIRAALAYVKLEEQLPALPLPSHESQVRPLLRVPEDKWAESWSTAVNAAAERAKPAPESIPTPPSSERKLS